MRNLVIAILAVSFLFNCNSFSKEEKNRKLVLDFYKLALVDHKHREAAELYLSEDYKQHNPHAATGRKAFIDVFDEFFKILPNSSFEIKRSLADGDLVAVHVYMKPDPTHKGHAVVDIFRVEGDKVVEHWDVIQEIPENPKNENTMF
ncbi:nuclear transport factor 2 family protein [Leptospira sarikeiensis]|uniref:Polyketide cyclase n=1 Tax=Leptospira sarikeiensis TaxID=2484943 RepID=A0A4R9KGS2_9LEPT|nr:nuclear transport factor 2 family protein [Leptospira sarikeiensis]TGL64668.1 polyketide cyclase [Leptospira sarikeiensis]